MTEYDDDMEGLRRIDRILPAAIDRESTTTAAPIRSPRPADRASGAGC